MKNILKSKILFSFVILVISSCGFTSQEFPARDFYTLDIGNIEKNKSTGSEDIKIMRVRLNPKYYHQDFNYKLKENKFTNDYYNQFYKPVDTMVISELYKFLNNSGVFRQVLAQNSIISTKYYVYTNILDIYADFSGPTPKSVLNIEFLVTDESYEMATTVFKSAYNRETEIKSNLPESIVEGWNNNMLDIFTEFQNDLLNLSEFN